MGEWATRDNKPTPSFQSALGDAAFLTGLERNADVVIMSCYAPLFVNVNPGGQQWATDLIGYNALVSFGSPSYYVQKMFYCNKGDVVLPITLTPSQAMFASASRDEATGDVILKLVNAAETPQEMEISLQGAATIGKTARMEVLAGGLTERQLRGPADESRSSGLHDRRRREVRAGISGPYGQRDSILDEMSVWLTNHCFFPNPRSYL